MNVGNKIGVGRGWVGALLAVSAGVVGFGCNAVLGIDKDYHLGGEAGSGGTLPGECSVVSDCESAVPECKTAIACDNGTCVFENAADGTPLSTQSLGDCAQDVCDGNGGTRKQALENDVPDDGKVCTIDSCNGTTAVHTVQTSVPCYTGPDGTQGMGVCVGGTQACDTQGNPTGGCIGEVIPTAEACGTPFDEDCNGSVNDNCPCTPGEGLKCYDGPPATEGVGSCTGGMQYCNADGQGFGPCTGQVLPETEQCDGLLDQDCDGLVDLSDGCECVGMVEDKCYSGPPGTALNLPCHAGTKTCQPNGKYGACVGEVVPSAEVCNSGTNESCDGVASCTGTPAWSKRFGDVESQFGRSVAIDGAGNAYLTGTFDGTINFGGGALSGFHSIYLAKFDSLGNHLWSKNLGGILQNATVFVDVAPDGSPVVAGNYNGTLSPGGGISLTNNDGANAFVVKFDSGGNAEWAKQFGAADGQTVTAFSIDGAGNLLLGALPGMGIDFGGGNLTGSAVLAKLDSLGNHLWSKAFTVTGMSMSVRGIGADTAGNVYFGGGLNGVVDLGGNVLLSNAADVYAAKFTSAGAHVWSKVFGSANNEIAAGVTVDAAGNTILMGSYFAAVSFGGPTINPYGSYDLYVAKLDTNGNHVWSKGFGDIDIQEGQTLAVDSAGNIIVGGYFLGSFGFGGPKVTAVNPAGDFFMGKLDGQGNAVWIQSFGNDQDGQSSAEGNVGVDASGNVYLAASLSGTISLGGPLLPPGGGWDAGIAKFVH